MRWLTIFVMLGLLTCCQKKTNPNTLKIAASPVPHAQMLYFIEPYLKEQGIDLRVIEVDDYNIPNRALAEKEVDANFFQHIPFLEDQIKDFDYPIKCYARIHLEPMGIYSQKIKRLTELESGAVIAIPNDPTNEYRALALLEKSGLIELDPDVELRATVNDIQNNPKKFRFREIDAALLGRTLDDVAIAAIPTNFALQAKLNPAKDALAIENENSPYANILVIRMGEGEDPRLQALKKEMQSEKMGDFIFREYRGAIIPILKECP